jgi:hypothetical protein
MELFVLVQLLDSQFLFSLPACAVPVVTGLEETKDRAGTSAPPDSDRLVTPSFAKISGARQAD